MSRSPLFQRATEIKIDCNPPRLSLPGFDVTIETSTASDNPVVIATTKLKNAPEFHCAFSVPVDDASGLISAFSIDAFAVAILEDIPMQERANHGAEKLLQKIAYEYSLSEKELLRDFRASWKKCVLRLSEHWVKIDGETPWVNRFSMLQASHDSYVGLAARMTRIGCDEIYGVLRGPSGRYFQISQIKGAVPIAFFTEASVTALPSARTIDLQTPGRGDDFERARSSFDLHRTSGTVRPIDAPGCVAWETNITEDAVKFTVQFSDGDVGSCMFFVDETASPLRFHASFRERGASIGIFVYFDDDGVAKIERSATHEKRFSNLEELDRHLNGVFKVLLALDLPFTRKLAAEKSTPFPSSHPSLTRLNLCEAQKPIIQAFLGKPYKKASERVAKRQRTTAVVADKVARGTELQKTLADGRVLGVVDHPDVKSIEPFLLNKSRLGQICRTVTSAGKSRRVIKPLYGFNNSRPFTAKHIAKLPPIGSCDDLSNLHDSFLGCDNRDFVETSHRLSFYLGAGEKNPLMEGRTDIKHIGPFNDGLRIRVTRMLGDRRHHAVAFSVVPNVALSEMELWKTPITGAGFAALVMGNESMFYARQAMTGLVATCPEAHRQAIVFAINLEARTPKQAGDWIAAFEQSWIRISGAV